MIFLNHLCRGWKIVQPGASLSVVRWLLHTFCLHYCNIGVKTVQGRLEEETRKRQELEQRMSDVLTYMQSLSAATGVPPPASLFAQPPPPDPYSTPVSVASFPLHSEHWENLWILEFSLDLWPPVLAVADLLALLVLLEPATRDLCFGQLPCWIIVSCFI
jgi:hypothetical protein